MGVGVRAQSLVRTTLLVVVTLLTLPLLARTHLAGYVEQGGQRHLNSNIFAITRSGATQTNPYSMQSYPSATVTVYRTGTLTLATIYSTPSGTAKSNPFTASSNAYYSFYIDDGVYDIRFSGGGIDVPYTWSGIATTDDSFTTPVTGFGAVCDGTTDDTLAIQAAINVVGGHTVTLPAGTCKITDQLLIDQNFVSFRGVGGIRSTVLLYMPTVDNEAAIKVKFPTATTISYVTISDLWIRTDNTTNQKIGIWIVDGSGTRVENILIGQDGSWTGGASVAPFTGGGSIGIKTQGRDYGRFRRVYIAADFPLWIGLNANSPTLDLDHHNFDGLDTHPNGDGPGIYVEEGANLTNVTFENSANVFGSYVMYWLDAAGTYGTSYSVTFRQYRAEQMTVSGGYLFYISLASGIQGLRFEDIVGGGSTQNVKGVFLRGVSFSAVFDRFAYYGSLECINADSTVDDIDWRSSTCFGAGATASLGTLVNVWEEDIISGAPMPRNGRWLTPNSFVNAGVRRRVMGVNDMRGTGTLANGATVAVPSGSGALVTGIIHISFKGATLDGAISCSMSSLGIHTLATTDATIAGCTGNVAGDFTLHFISASSIVIRNNLGESVTYNYHLNWN